MQLNNLAENNQIYVASPQGIEWKQNYDKLKTHWKE